MAPGKKKVVRAVSLSPMSLNAVLREQANALQELLVVNSQLREILKIIADDRKERLIINEV